MSVGLSVCLSVGLSVGLSIGPSIQGWCTPSAFKTASVQKVTSMILKTGKSLKLGKCLRNKFKSICFFYFLYFLTFKNGRLSYITKYRKSTPNPTPEYRKDERYDDKTKLPPVCYNKFSTFCKVTPEVLHP